MVDIKELIAALEKDSEKPTQLVNNAETWRRIGSKDTFPELALSEQETTKVIDEFITNNEYRNI
jgi:hypothetical protein